MPNLNDEDYDEEEKIKEDAVCHVCMSELKNHTIKDLRECIDSLEEQTGQMKLSIVMMM